MKAVVLDNHCYPKLLLPFLKIVGVESCSCGIATQFRNFGTVSATKLNGHKRTKTIANAVKQNFEKKKKRIHARALFTTKKHLLQCNSSGIRSRF